MQRIVLDRMTVDCLVGVLESEQRAIQPLEIEVVMDLDLVTAADTGGLDTTVDYAAVCEQVEVIAQHGRFRLIESLALAICRLLLLPPAGEPRAPIDAVEVRVRKPLALGGRAHPSVILGLRREDLAFDAREPQDGVALDVCVETPLSAVYRVRLEEGARWWPDPGVMVHVVAGAVEMQGRRLRVGDRVARGTGHTLTAVEPALLLVVGQP
jgi:dihydroneopterin aldolase